MFYNLSLPVEQSQSRSKDRSRRKDPSYVGTRRDECLELNIAEPGYDSNPTTKRNHELKEKGGDGGSRPNGPLREH